ncbi:N(2)-fixation sustaining protein CowN [Shewanella sp. A32]|uniref:N(2)-fixation sustaining protein CowN n=1 Tax=Shewanella sp. A32 TaxID=3031327 RepID=UPI0023B9A630|nr:N(2)-fixation sustaining protein CowN [Shewanella sp. A32]MDF0533364.1 N(2)-fixation sustaining protein CowN [Shewanella sp. A32]
MAGVIQRYQSENVKGDRMAIGEAMLSRILAHIEQDQSHNPLWQHFRQKVLDMRAGNGPQTDALFLLHSNVYYLRDLLDEVEDDEAEQQLDAMERDFF